MLYGAIKGAFDFKLRKLRLNFKHLPKNFHDLKIVQISDLHAGGFKSPAPIREIVELVNQQNPDLVVFTGDLVNYRASEAEPFVDNLRGIQAPMGTFSILGNHDYGNYVQWKSEAEMQENFNNMLETHERLGWTLLRNEHYVLRKMNEDLTIIGVENWSAYKRFPNYGNLEKALESTSESGFKILLSHDPTHWNKAVIKAHKDIDLTLSGHTHGMQFGFDTKRIKLSPAKMMYKQWAGLYNKGQQYLYVNRGLGFFGFPARVGVLPEITVIELGRG